MADPVSEQSPFAIPMEHVQALCRDEGFQVLRSYLARDADFCASHSNSSPQAQETWLLHRDLLHALIMPVVFLFQRASQLAEAALCTRAPEDLELAFSGEARGAFICLQCFITEEADWCTTRGCPACVTLAILSTESHIRLTIAASLLSTSPHSTPSTSTVSTPTSETPVSTTATTANGRTLPPLPYMLPALRDALDSDPLWGPTHWTHMLTRALLLSTGIQALITECVGLDALVSSPRDNGAEKRYRGAKIRVGKIAKRQLRLQAEEMEMIRRCAMQCWARAAVPSHVRGEILGRGQKRSRRLTCP